MHDYQASRVANKCSSLDTKNHVQTPLAFWFHVMFSRGHDYANEYPFPPKLQNMTKLKDAIWRHSAIMRQWHTYHTSVIKHLTVNHDDVIKWKHFPRYWPFVRRIHRSAVNSPHRGQWRGAFMFLLICVWINGWENSREAGNLRRYRAHYDVIVMCRLC